MSEMGKVLARIHKAASEFKEAQSKLLDMCHELARALESSLPEDFYFSHGERAQAMGLKATEEYILISPEYWVHNGSLFIADHELVDTPDANGKIIETAPRACLSDTQDGMVASTFARDIESGVLRYFPETIRRWQKQVRSRAATLKSALPPKP